MSLFKRRFLIESSASNPNILWTFEPNYEKIDEED